MKTIAMALVIGGIASTTIAAPQEAKQETTAYTCPCSGTKICTGPRGGRYCITSGGNKRYIK